MKPVIDAVRAFDAARLEAEVLWGDEILRRAEALAAVRNDPEC